MAQTAEDNLMTESELLTLVDSLWKSTDRYASDIEPDEVTVLAMAAHWDTNENAARDRLNLLVKKGSLTSRMAKAKTGKRCLAYRIVPMG